MAGAATLAAELATGYHHSALNRCETAHRRLVGPRQHSVNAAAALIVPASRPGRVRPSGGDRGATGARSQTSAVVGDEDVGVAYPRARRVDDQPCLHAVAPRDHQALTAFYGTEALHAR
jgi:hypothetical protein